MSFQIVGEVPPRRGMVLGTTMGRRSGPSNIWRTLLGATTTILLDTVRQTLGGTMAAGIMAGSYGYSFALGIDD